MRGRRHRRSISFRPAPSPPGTAPRTGRR
jgi:hypothetical protein